VYRDLFASIPDTFFAVLALHILGTEARIIVD
jgi:hypothetical protein